MERQDELDDRVQAAAEDMERDVAELQEHSEEVGGHIDEARSDWRRKQADSAVPGAEPADEDQAAREVAEDWEGAGPGASDAGH